MKLVQFAYKHNPNDLRIGYMDGCCLVDVNAREKYVPDTMIEFLKNDINLGILQDLRKKYQCCTTCLNQVILKPPINGMDKILCVGPNYTEHYEQQQNEASSVIPTISAKFPSTVIGPDDVLKIRPAITQQVSWEVQLGAVIGRKASLVKAEEAHKYVFGYTVAQNISAKDWENENGGEFLLAKGMDTFCPIGPCIVTIDEIEDPYHLAVKCSINGVSKQKSNTSHLAYRIPQIIERLSSVMTLLPGDLILTGSLGAIGGNATAPVYLKFGDVVRSEIEKIGFFDFHVDEYIKPDDYYDYVLQTKCYLSK